MTAVSLPAARRVPLGSGSLVGAVLAVSLALDAAAPPDRVQGDLVRIMYVHVPSAWIAYLAFGITFLASLAFLVRRRPGPDRLAAASAEVGLLFTGLTLLSGSIWGRATWGVWWDWDPRLTTTAIMFVAYLAYVLLRASIVDRGRRARLAAVLGVVAFANVPVVHFSVLWWRGLHQAPTVLRPGSPSIDPVLLVPLLVGVAAFTLLYAWLVLGRIRLERERDAVEAAIGAAA
jgi:heme exporter protein C